MKKIITILVISLAILVLPSFVLAQGNQQGQGEQQQIGAGNGEQVRSVVQNHEKVQVRTMTALQQMSQRNQVLKFMIGPDYKNAGQVRSDVVSLRNDINKLEQIKEESLPADTGDIQGAIDELQAEADSLETRLTEQLSGFSLFGWLVKLLAR